MGKFIEHQILIIGGGTAGIMVAAQLLQKDKKLDVAIIEPSEKHYYQPAWTLVGAGTFDNEETVKPMKECLPPRAAWIKDAVTKFIPENNMVETAGGAVIHYEFLIVAPGIQINWGAVKGLPETINRNGVCSNYDFNYAPHTWEAIRNTKKGRAIFTQPNTPVKCGGAPQKIMYLADEAFRQMGVRQQVQIDFYSPGGVIFGVEYFAKTLREVVKKKGIDVFFKHNLKEVKGEEKLAIFDVTDPDGNVTEKAVAFEMAHIVPPMSAPDFVRESALAIQDGPLKGWVDVHHGTLQHNRFPNVFSLGDVAGIPTAKTGSAIRKQAPVVVQNIFSIMKERPIEVNPIYNGYSSCPLVTGYGKMVLAEFDYKNQPDMTFPIDQSEERYDMWILKKFMLPWMYWNMMLRGKA